MHQALEVVHGAKIVDFTMGVLVKIVSLTCDSKQAMEKLTITETSSPWEQVWCSGESTRLPPMWPGVDSDSVPYVG